MSTTFEPDIKAPLNILSVEDLQGISSILAIVSRNIGTESRKQLIGLFLVIFIPLLVFIPFTIIDDVFEYGKVIAAIDEERFILGMSFLGDTMVWPFIFIVPLCLLLTKVAIKRSTTLLNKVITHINPEWIKDPSEYGYEITISKSKSIFRMGYGWKGKILRFSPWIIALIFWVYNTDTCSFQFIFSYPYRTNIENVRLKSEVKNSKSLTELQLSQKKRPLQWDGKGNTIPIPKWDCDPKNASLSWLSARIWTIFYYGIVPFILIRLVTIISGVTYFLLNIIRWGKRSDLNGAHRALIIKPFSPDRFGGLSYLADTGMSYLYVISSFALLVAMFFLKEAAVPSWHNYLMMIPFIPIALIAFLIPTLTLRNSILESKEAYLSTLSEKINSLSSTILQDHQKNAFQEQADGKLFYQL